MFTHILVPLDGSKLAEAALPAAVSLAQVFNGCVTLLHVIEQDAPEEVHRDRHLTDADQADAYLESGASLHFPESVEVDCHVHSAAVADVTRSIVEHSSAEFQPDLIILTSHGNSGMHELVFGNIAQQVAAESGVPVLMIKPIEGLKSFQPARILVPLDNESIHDAVLPTATSLARAYQAELNLLCVIPTRTTLSGEQAAAGSLMPVTITEYLNLAEEDAREHLQAHLDALKKEAIPATADILRGDPAPVIARSADDLDAGLIVFGTHGRVGMEAFWNRSVAAGVVRRTSRPVLLVPLPGPPEK